LLERHRAGSLAVQAFVAEWGAGRLGVAWSDPGEKPPTIQRIARRAAAGFSLGALVAGLLLAFGAATHAVRFASPRVPGVDLLLGLLVAGLLAIRDELILRGLVLRAFSHTLSPRLQLAACGVVAAAAKLGQLDGPPLAALSHAAGLAAVAVAAFAAMGFAAVWQEQRGAFMAWGAHAGFGLMTTTAISGGLCDARWAISAWGGGEVGFEGSSAMASALGVVTVAVLALWYRAGARTR
jgi:hypothetical protein